MGLKFLFTGAEMLAKKHDLNVIFTKVRKLKGIL
jgi:hypothetical protein